MTGSERRLLVIQHVPWEDAGRIATAVAALDVPMTTRLLLAESDPELPPLSELAGVVVLGGPMAADDVSRHPALAIELDLLRRAVDADLPVLGVCLGHQLLGVALGGVLDPGATHEIGVAPIELNADSVLGAAGSRPSVLHWHGDNVSAPPGAEVLARSPGCPVQAFRVGSALGLQFHLEVGPAELDRWLDVASARDEAGGGDGAARIRSDLANADAGLQSMAAAVFGGFADGLRR